MRFKTRPFEIEAVRFNGEQSYQEIVDFTSNQFRIYATPDRYGEVYDHLHDTWVKVYTGQWIIRGGEGEYYPCDNEVFEKKYEPVNE